MLSEAQKERILHLTKVTNLQEERITVLKEIITILKDSVSKLKQELIDTDEHNAEMKAALDRIIAGQKECINHLRRGVGDI